MFGDNDESQFQFHEKILEKKFDGQLCLVRYETWSVDGQLVTWWQVSSGQHGK